MSTRDKLLTLAEESVRRRGFGATSYAHLAEPLGIRKASVHHHFPAKGDLGAALLERHVERLAERLAETAQGARTGGEALRGIVALHREELGGGEYLGLLTALAAERAALPEAMQARLREAVRNVTDWLEDMFRRGRQDRSIAVPGDFASEAQAALAQLTGAQIVAHARGDALAFDSAIAPLLARTTRH
jgi:TetR/AcrR family transcriptional repressor of nem operon